MCKEHLDFNYCFDENYCKKCKGFCCKGEGYVFLEPGDIEQIANFLKLLEEEFLVLYTRKFFDRVCLLDIKSNSEHQCCFLNDEGLCEIYSARPKQCKTFPFWESLKNLSFDEIKQLCPAVKLLG